jgi:hypothetical protein
MERLLKILEAGDDLVCAAESCVKMANKSNLQSRTLSIVTRTNENIYNSSKYIVTKVFSYCCTIVGLENVRETQ